MIVSIHLIHQLRQVWSWFFTSGLVVSTSAIDGLETLVSKIAFVLSGKTILTHSSRLVPTSAASYSNDPYPRFQGHTITEYRAKGTRYGHSFNGILIGTYTRRTKHCHFEWPWVTVKYSMTRSVARFICDSWASCL